jgi:hypothetical protein
MNFETLKNWFLNVAGIFILWIVIHYAAANLYARFCAELTFIGFVQSIFIAEAVHCIALRWVIYNGGQIIHKMWISHVLISLLLYITGDIVLIFNI